MSGLSLKDLSRDELSNIAAMLEDPIDIFKRVNNAVENITFKGMKLGEITLQTKHFPSEDDEEDNKVLDQYYLDLTMLVTKLTTSSNYCVGGIQNIYSVKDVVLKLNDSNVYSSDFNGPNCFNLENLEVQKMMEQCEPAKFGNLISKKTEHNPEVRNAMEAKKFCLARKPERGYYYKELECIHTIRKQIEAHLCPKIKLEPYRVNIYGKGDFFKPHVDTPVDLANMIGSLVVCLPSKHSGGQLVVKSGNNETVFDFGEKSGNTNVVQWAAFFSDCVHEVKQVTDGYRVAVTYNIIRSTAVRKKENNKQDTVSSDLILGENTGRHTEYVQQLVQKVEEENKEIGFMLFHKYTMSGLKRDGLKGSDRLLYLALANTQKFNLELVPSALHCSKVIPDNETTYGAKRVSEDLVTMNVYRFTQEDLERQENNKRSRPYDHDQDETLTNGIPFIMALSETNADILSHDSRDAAYTGNQNDDGYDTTLYQTASLIVTPKSVITSKYKKQKFSRY
jgi:predicted 2-oxoglutarate/Fe(II)-dependent dioxygenase YbiX